MRTSLTRRGLLRGAAAALAAPWIIRSSALGAGATVAPSNRVGLGFIGAGNINANFHIPWFLGAPDAQVAAVCDVMADKRQALQQRADQHYAQHLPKGTYKGCAAYNDFRDLIADGNVDAVVIGVPDHWHTIPALRAAEAGKDVYLEKPSTLTIREGQALVETVKRYGRVFQHGTQQRSDWKFRFAAELARNERIGKLHTIEVGSPGGAATGIHPPAPVPPGFDYDFWLGQAPPAPYTPLRCRDAATWIFIQDYAGGHVTGWGIHHVDCAHWGMGTDDTGPVEVEGTGTFPKDGLYDSAVAWKVECRYANGLKMIYADEHQVAHGVKYIGTDGWVYVHRGAIDAQPKSLLQSAIRPNEIHLYESSDHHRNFLDCIKTRARTICPVEVAHRSTVVCHLTNICLWLGRKVRWDPQKEQFVNDPEAERFTSRAMRGPWHL